MTTPWLDSSVNANHFKPTYVEGFIDISGGDIRIRNSGNLYVDGKIMENSVYLENKYATINDPTFNGHITMNGDVSMNFNVDISGEIVAQGAVTATQFINLSDYRIKKEVIPLNQTPITIDNLNPVQYMNILLNKPDIGFIAHEVQREIPCIVNGNKDDVEYQSVNYIGLIGILVNELQQLKTVVSKQQCKIEYLENSHK
jgi:hypothetical protein